MKKRIFVLFIFLTGVTLFSCSKDCTWEYNRRLDTWDYVCTQPINPPRPPEPIPFYTKIQTGIYKVEAIEMQFMPNLPESIQKSVEKEFKKYFDEIQNIEFAEYTKTPNTVDVRGTPAFDLLGSYNDFSISLNGESYIRMPENINLGLCKKNLIVEGTITLNKGFPESGKILYLDCNDRTTVIDYRFKIKK